MRRYLVVLTDMTTRSGISLEDLTVLDIDFMFVKGRASQCEPYKAAGKRWGIDYDIDDGGASQCIRAWGIDDERQSSGLFMALPVWARRLRQGKMPVLPLRRMKCRQS